MPYTPLDSSALYSTAFRTGPLPWAVWTAILAAMDSDGVVSINPSFLAAQWPGVSRAEIEEAWSVHTKPDPDSKNEEFEGRRLIPYEGGRWLVVSHQEYRNKYSKAIRAEQLRAAKQRQRQREKISQPGNGKRATTVDVEEEF